MLARCQNTDYLCNVFFIVLDLRLTKVGVQRYSFFFALKSTNFKVAIKREQTKLACSLPSVSNFDRRSIFNFQSSIF